MKKKLIAAGAASLAVAAMPIVGVFAEAAPATILPRSNMVDNITLTVLKTCEMDVTANAIMDVEDPEDPFPTGDYENTYDLGTYTVAHIFDGPTTSGEWVSNANGVTGTEMTITCNAEGANHAAGWNLTAAATPLEREDNDAHAIPFGAFVDSGASSVWSAQVAVTKAQSSTMPSDFSAYYTIGTGWNSFTSAKSDSTVVSGTAGYSVDGLVVTPSYKAYGAPTQPVGTYNGSITYTLHDLTPAQDSGQVAEP